jgi:uncharacterized membrane protein HdeD (DUF308 family)
MKHLENIKNAVNHFFWTLVIQGAVFIILAVLIIIYPALLIALVAATFIIIGVSSLVFAVKLRKLWNRVPDFLK